MPENSEGLIRVTSRSLVPNVRLRSPAAPLGGKMASQPQRNLSAQDADNGIRREKVRADISRRLQPVCSHLSEREFSMLVNLMTERQLKSERRTSLF